MKKLLVFLMIMFVSLSSFSQDDTTGIDYPRYEVDSLGQKVVVMTIEQAQKLDNNSDLLYLFEELNAQIASYDSICIQAINEKNIVISEQKILIEELNANLDTKDTTIFNLQKQIAEYQLREVMLNDQITNLNEQIDLKDKLIRKQKVKMIIGGSIGGVAIIGLVLGLVLGK